MEIGNILFLSTIRRRKYQRSYEDDLKTLHAIRGGLGAPLQLICQAVFVTYGIRPLIDANDQYLNVSDWQGNIISITVLLPVSLVLSVISILKVD